MNRQHNKSPFIIGIGGGTGSGKTTLSLALQQHFSSYGVLILSYDDYYVDLSHLPPSERRTHNFDHPCSVDSSLFFEHLSQLSRGVAIESPGYDYVTHQRINNGIHVEPKPLIIVDGILIFHDEQIRNIFDLKVFVDAPADLRFIRRLQRDMRDRGRTLESVIRQYEATVRPMHQTYVEPTRHFADLLVPELDEGSLHCVSNAILAKMRQNPPST